MNYFWKLTLCKRVLHPIHIFNEKVFTLERASSYKWSLRWLLAGSQPSVYFLPKQSNLWGAAKKEKNVLHYHYLQHLWKKGDLAGRKPVRDTYHIFMWEEKRTHHSPSPAVPCSVSSTLSPYPHQEEALQGYCIDMYGAFLCYQHIAPKSVWADTTSL